MSSITPLTLDSHRNKGWLRPTSYKFAANDVVAPLVMVEVPQAVMAMPIGFMLQEEKFHPVAVLGLANGQNLFVTLDGQWQGRYIPAIYRSYPFRLVENAEGVDVLCVDETSGLIVESPAGEPLFNGDGQPADSVKQIMERLGSISQSQGLTMRICAQLQQQQLLEPWKIILKTNTGERHVEGLYCVNEAALNSLSASALQDLQSNSCFPMIYCQLLSMQHLPKMGEMFNIRTAEPRTELDLLLRSGNLNLDNLSHDGIINLSNI